MAISIICAWIAVLSLMLTASKFIVKKNRRLNRIFRKIHIPAGIVLIGSGLVHGLLAGNSPGASLGEISIGAELFSLNPGTICFVLAIALGVNYCFRKQLKKAWIRIHRVLTAMILVMLMIHVAQVGITLPELFKTGEGQQTSEIWQKNPTAETTQETESLENAVSEPEAENGNSETTAAGTTSENGNSEATAAETTTETGNSEPIVSEIPDSDTTTVSADVTDEADQGLSENLEVTFSGAKLNDGTYEGSAEGFKGTITASVTVENGAVTSVQIISQSDTPRYFSRAESLTDTIVDEQSLEVDAVSGATYSSKGILCAVYDALEEAVYEGELQITIPETRGRKH